jgi:2-keto-4-pentenoate hydratase/2-oxohepta-3-ene-1,7-dioic acid hydratase in catechol pathway
MKLMRYGAKGAEKPALVDAQGTVRDLSGIVPDITAQTMRPENLKRLAELDASKLPAVASPGRIAPPWSGMGKFICIGLNYSDHAAETGSPIPKEPIIFMKPTNVVVGCNDAVVLPKGSVKTDWEVELGVVIGTKARYVEQADALKYVAGYCVVNDVSEREFQIERGGQWTKGKSADTFCPMGPWLVTADEVPDPGKLQLWTEVNGERRQNSNTADLIFGVNHIVSYVSQFMTLLPGDVIPTGTPSGVGLGFKPPKFLKPGDRVRLSVEGLGEQNQLLVAYQG